MKNIKAYTDTSVDRVVNQCPKAGMSAAWLKHEIMKNNQQHAWNSQF
jgi:hypothetical protein